MYNILLAVHIHFLIGQLYTVQAFQQFHSLSLLSIRENILSKVKVYTRGRDPAQHKANIPLAVVVNKMCLIKNQKKKKNQKKREKIAMKTKATTKAKDNNKERERESSRGRLRGCQY